MSEKKQDAAKAEAGVASDAENRKLKHSVGGVTTRDDATDLGVPMLPGDPNEPVGPEDALGPGPKRGDYSQRIGPSNYHPTTVVPRPDAQEAEPQVEVVVQREWAAEIGDEKRAKGGVSTDRAREIFGS
jgi:hypothetical protein